MRVGRLGGPRLWTEFCGCAHRGRCWLSNAPSPFDEGWFDTCDQCRGDGEHVRIPGPSASDLINVGGEVQVYPVEVESLTLQPRTWLMSQYGANRIQSAERLLQRVSRLKESEDLSELGGAALDHCKERMPRYMRPMVVFWQTNRKRPTWFKSQGLRNAREMISSLKFEERENRSLLW